MLFRSLFNENSIHFLNNARYSENFRRMFKYFENLPKNNDNFCLTASIVLASYGLREAKDIDYLYLEKELEDCNKELVSSHNQYIELYYPDDLQELILNPKNYFFFNGIKFLTLKNVHLMKQKRNEEKDLVDLNLIERVVL